MAVPTLFVPRAEFVIEDPWAVPPSCRPAALRRATDGSAPRLETTVAAYYDPQFLTLVFRGADDGVVATYLEHDAPLWQEDVVEAFLAPSDSTTYFEIEVNPLGTTFDARIESPDGVRTTMRTDLAWTADGLVAAVRREATGFATVLRVPFAALGSRARPGHRWRGNFFRVDRSASGDEYTAWSPTMKSPPDFHVVAAFGDIEFG